MTTRYDRPIYEAILSQLRSVRKSNITPEQKQVIVEACITSANQLELSDEQRSVVEMFCKEAIE